MVTDRYVYDAFGRTIGQVGTTGNVYLFAGEQRDFEVGLDYLRARWLSVANGRFVTRDSIAGVAFIPASFNPYVYAFNRPVTLIDPSGHWPSEIHARMIRTAFTGLLHGVEIQTLIMQDEFKMACSWAAIPTWLN